MALKDLLVHVDGSKANPRCLDAAMRLAAAHDAHLTGLFVAPAWSVTPAYTEIYVTGEVLEQQRTAAATRADEARQEFEEKARNAGLSTEWRFVEGDLARTLSLHARYADLLIIGQADPADDRSVSRATVEQVLLDVGRPVLVVPYVGAPETAGARVLVAWNASREAMRAIHDALPVLERAESVHVLSVNPSGGPAGDGDIPGADISLHLARHGVRVQSAHVEASDISAGELLLSRASDQRADLIVMGAYGHSRYRELVLGGATRQILESMTLPVLMSH